MSSTNPLATLSSINDKITDKHKKIFHLVTSIIISAFSLFLFFYHFTVGVIWFSNLMVGYGMSDVLMFGLNFLTLSYGVTGIVGVVHQTVDDSNRKALLQYNVCGCMIGLPFLSICFFFIALTEYGYSVINNTSRLTMFRAITPGLNYAHTTLALILSVFIAILAIVSSISGFMYYQVITKPKPTPQQQPSYPSSVVVIQQ
ncbi:predicted protein [Naegleria gruberi]|uniref:Predicted protein n=1 Tax=Naegleria gruberi TaxID=5762 RepID=D2VRG4_NAEGR|nr:uncharacterized protein NAEGRDRAFT_71576 [Naegleria gruberi]EFC40669.1 predicted protein [Naegleria gruberi]|eukprot:XP_002673413.1 predicted protein [Naegleria gruberi strain NEG-M]